MLINVERGSLNHCKVLYPTCMCTQHFILWPTLLLINTKYVGWCWRLILWKSKFVQHGLTSSQTSATCCIQWCWMTHVLEYSTLLVFKKILCCLLFTYFLTSLINRNWVKIWQENEGTQRRTGAEKENWNSWNWRGLLSINTINSNSNSNDNSKNYYY